MIISVPVQRPGTITTWLPLGETRPISGRKDKYKSRLMEYLSRIPVASALEERPQGSLFLDLYNYTLPWRQTITCLRWTSLCMHNLWLSPISIHLRTFARVKHTTYWLKPRLLARRPCLFGLTKVRLLWVKVWNMINGGIRSLSNVIFLMSQRFTRRSGSKRTTMGEHAT